jgi:hypothetical protein
MKQFIIEWCINMVMALAIVVYIGIFFLVALLLDDGTTKWAIYIALWVVFYAVTTVTSYVRYCNRKRK